MESLLDKLNILKNLKIFNNLPEDKIIEKHQFEEVKEKIKDAVLIFILPPSLEELKNRLEGRRTETAEVIAKRLAIVESEYSKKDLFTYQMFNDNLDTSIVELEKIINKERQIDA